MNVRGRFISHRAGSSITVAVGKIGLGPPCRYPKLGSLTIAKHMAKGSLPDPTYLAVSSSDLQAQHVAVR